MQNLVVILSLLGFSYFSHTQIAPPGLTNKGGASWYALGFQQQLKTKESSIFGYVGTGRAGTSERNNPFQNHVLFVINTAYKKSFNTQLYISTTISYRHQEIYTTNAITKKQEFRFALEVGKVWKINRFELKPLFKQEFRKFYDTSFRNWNESIQLRSRVKFSTKAQLTKTKKHHVSAHAEVLFVTTEHINPSNYWDKFKYSDIRLSTFYSYSMPKPNLKFSVGYMIDIIGLSQTTGANYISLDVLWVNPFQKN